MKFSGGSVDSTAIPSRLIARSIKIFLMAIGRRDHERIRVGADCKLSAKPPSIALQSDHRDSVGRSLGCIHRLRVHRRGERQVGEAGGQGRKGVKVHPPRDLQQQRVVCTYRHECSWLPKMNYADVDQLPGNVSLSLPPFSLTPL